MLKLLHISDLHFGPPYLPKVGEALQAIAPRLHPDVIVVSGDLTQRAKPRQFTDARQFIEQLPDVPRIIVPGNHDVPLFRVRERLLEPHSVYRQIIQDDLDHVCRVDGAVIVALNSTSPRRSITNGRIHSEQLDFCEQSFAGTTEATARIVVAHHHFAPAPDYERDQVMPKSKRAIRRFVTMDVDLILGGHLHRAYIGDSLDIYPGVQSGHQGIIIVQCGTTTSRRGRARERERNSFNLIKVVPDFLHITHYMYFDDTDLFEPISRHTFPRRHRRSIEPD